MKLSSSWQRSECNYGSYLACELCNVRFGPAAAEPLHDRCGDFYWGKGTEDDGYTHGMLCCERCLRKAGVLW